MVPLQKPEGLDVVIYRKYLALFEQIQALGSAVVAFSGGVDSGLLAVVAYQALGQRMLAVTVRSSVETVESCQAAQRLAQQVGFPHQVVDFDDLANTKFVENPPDRCYFCKLERFQQLKKIALQGGFASLLEGSNATDEGDYRPGKRAVAELKVLSPLADQGFVKTEVRTLAKSLGLELWNRPSAPCLATRFPYGMKVTREGLDQIARGETFLVEHGYSPVRVRHYGSLARIEVSPEAIVRLSSEHEVVAQFFKQLGFTHVAVDLQGYRSGSLNEGIIS